MNKHQGFTMVEVIVAFAIIVISLGLLTTCFQLTSNLQTRAAQNKDNFTRVESDFYSGNGNITSSSQISIDFSGSGDIPQFSIDADLTEITVDGYTISTLK